MIMNKKEARETFEKIRQEYDQVPYPKYLNVNLVLVAVKRIPKAAGAVLVG